MVRTPCGKPSGKQLGQKALSGRVARSQVVSLSRVTTSLMPSFSTSGLGGRPGGRPVGW
jgi:hypothetical protein